jgi:NNP family nitrate/nitrite transporter-like MFS transporter
MGIGFAQSYETFLIFRVLIGAIGASFVITQYHTSLMFAPNCVGTANATTAGWGNLGGGVTQFVMPVLFSFLVLNLGLSEYWGWRVSMFLAGLVCFLTGIAYWRLTQDTPEGNFAELQAREDYAHEKKPTGTFWLACQDKRVWALFLIYGACFGIELTINNIAALYFVDYFGLGLKAAGYAAAAFGLMNIFARTLGGVFGDLFASKLGLRGRVFWLFLAVFAEGVALICFSQMKVLALAIPSLIVFSLFVQMSEGATYSVVPFVNKKALGSVAGIVGAGGNAGAVAAGFLFKSEGLSWSTGLLILGVIVTACSFSALLVRFSPEDEKVAEIEYAAARAERETALAEANG